jgi:hypothetical protein
VPIDTTEPMSPGWWLARLLKRLGEKRDHYDLLDSYYDGTHDIPSHATREVSNAYRRLMDVSRTNWAELIVEAVRERMQVVGFRTGAGGDRLGDQDAWRIWQGNSLDADASLVHAASLSMGMAYVIVGPVDPETGVPLITPEDPREVIVETDPRRRRKVIAGLKTYRDDVAGVDRAYVYLPGVVYRAVRASRYGYDVRPGPGGWEWDGDPQTYGPQIVPVVPFPNRPKLGRDVTRGEFETQLSVLDRINYSVLQRVEIATLQAFRQRAIKSDDLPDTDEDGNPIDYDDLFAADPGALWRLPATAEIWESGQVDLGPVRMAIRDDVQDLAAGTRTPLFYLTPEAANGSAEGAALAREGLIFKTRDRLVEVGEAWETVESHAFRFLGDDVRASRPDMEVIWASPERRSLAEKAGLSLRKVRETVWDLTPQEIEELERDDAAEALRAQAVALTMEVLGGGAGADGQPAAG